MKAKAQGTFLPLLILSLFTVFAVVGCSDDSNDQGGLVPPPEGAGEFLGYSAGAEKQTTCGNCHTGYQAKWVLAGHADAWATLDESGHRQEFCEPCHTVGPNGNNEETGGHSGVPDARYHDVQCESCHGPGQDHLLENPDYNKVTMSIKVSSEPPVQCGACHQGTHHPFVEQWENSKHASSNFSFLRERDECNICHTAQGALLKLGVDSRYEEYRDPKSEWMPIVCVVCHEPHHTENPANLRLPLTAASAENNMCITCHHKRAQPDQEAETTRGPHSPEGPLVLGEEVGWIPDGLVPPPEAIRGTHGSDRNTRLCASCHVAQSTVTDSSGFVFQSVGHLFSAIPCLENGIPVPDNSCDYNTTDRDFDSGCTYSGCHGDAVAALNSFNKANNDVDNSVAELQALLDQVDPAELDPEDGVFTVAEGADFNRKLAILPGSPTHNVFMITWLLDISKTAVKDEYGVSKPGGVSEE